MPKSQLEHFKIFNKNVQLHLLDLYVSPCLLARVYTKSINMFGEFLIMKNFACH